MHFIIYKTTNLVNGKYYIGQHMTRVLDDGYLGSGTALLRAIKKYGKENFSREILAHADNAEQLNALEAFYVGWDEVNSRSCYNLKTGGGGRGIIGAEVRQKISDAHKGRKYSAERRANISAGLKGRQKPAETRKKLSEANKGKVLSEETRKKIGQTLKGVKRSQEAIERSREGKIKELSEEAKRALLEMPDIHEATPVALIFRLKNRHNIKSGPVAIKRFQESLTRDA